MADEPFLAASSTLRHGPALVVVTGPPGCGRSTVLRRLATAVPGPVYAGGGLAMLATVPALALSRAVRARLPADDVHLLAEAVRSRVRGGLLILDDLQHCDPATIEAIPHLARTCRVVVALRTPHRIGDGSYERLREAATAWLPVPPLDHDAAVALARHTATRLDEAATQAVVARAGGNPLAITALARQAAAGRSPAHQETDQLAYALATALADLPRPARTALAALGLLGRPAPASLLGAGANDLIAAGLVAPEPGGALVPVSAYVAETAAGLLDQESRTVLHVRLAELTPPSEAARHLAAAGDTAGAYRAALVAADQAAGGERAALLLFACRLDTPVDLRVRLAAADAALTAGRPAEAASVLAAAGARATGAAAPLALEVAVLHGEALLQAGDPDAARDAVRGVPDAAAAPVVAARDRVLLLAGLATEPMSALELAEKLSARHPAPLPGLAAALAAVRAAHRAPGWDEELGAAAAPGGDPLIMRWSAWLLVEHLAEDGRLVESASAALRAAESCRSALAFGWETRFSAAADWALALHGHRSPGASSDAPAGSPGAPGGEETVDDAGIGGDGAEGVLRRAANLTDLALPDDARAYAVAATALIEADTGLLAAARSRLDGAPAHPAPAWVAREAAWLDGQPDRAVADEALPTGIGLLAGLHAITGRWAAHDMGVRKNAAMPVNLPGPARRTLTAWTMGSGFPAAADSWQPVALREQIRCLIAAGVTDTDRDRAVAALLRAEELADAAGLTVLAGRARRGLRRHQIHRDVRSPRSGGRLTQREIDVLRLVAAGEPTRRIAGQLGISTETVDTHIRASMRKLSARTRTEAAALAFAAPTARPDHIEDKDGR
ncbi:LuxR C-terminal-related transcriptional regulator [Actinoplanes sp. NPDC051851]|uniref:helix-turn-helix transcriptional regulator n=1 Tax=Actinoplanes sp. NPDC051851 TaxID=3154753 RepID=UPI003417BDEC